ncbi:hypothetical protein DACRYDRAFT_105354 [Dacryopinax primogenitus]|uniref:Uncharacterized protein n=1 Tax=Dacryopinax primogenitus (strain DJM 731) TaxID=1858805 RepID=M5G268_DACPD|nr:uncharacterized protein DACRYDRAFT_105354 [Dacryopinax primogenitus]EJU04291.1 hypothetical protein DACRYDRAFT_105354 [Dacryopinax primogenitus]
MFGKAARFPIEKRKDNFEWRAIKQCDSFPLASDVPPPGYYQPKEIDDAPYKRGAFLEKSERKVFDKVPDGPGPSDYQSITAEVKGNVHHQRKPSASQNQDHQLRQQIQELQGENARLLKERRHEVHQLESKLEQAEARTRELVREKGTLQTEAAIAIKEQRLAQDRETTARLAHEKAEKEVKQLAERASKYGALQRRLEELEKMHLESKSKSRADKGTLESDLEHARAFVAEKQRELDSVTSHRESESRRIQDLKRAHAMAETENQELRSKLHILQLSASGAEASQDQKRQFQAERQAMQARHAKELAELQLKLHDQESVAIKSKQELRDKQGESRKTNDELRKVRDELKRVREELEATKLKHQKIDNQHREQEKDNDRLFDARVQALQKEITSLREHSSNAKQVIDEERMKTFKERDDLKAQLQHVREVMSAVATKYGALSATMHKLRHQGALERATAEATRIRLEGLAREKERRIRQLAVALQLQEDATVTMLHGLNHYDSLIGAMLRHQSRFIDRETIVRPQALQEDPQLDSDSAWREELVQLQERTQREVVEFFKFDKKWVEEGYHQVLDRASNAESENEMTKAKLAEHETAHTNAQSALADAEVRLATAEQCVTSLKAQLSEVTDRVTQSAAESGRIQSGYQAELNKLTKQMNSEKAYAAQMALDLAHGKSREAALAVDVDSLQENLAQVERYKSEYQALLAEVRVILSRNALAEDEAERLSRFNAEILGHQNPMQKILYVDKLRREMADVKQASKVKLIVSTLERDGAEEARRKLQEELASYKAVEIPMDTKPRSTMTRVARVPFAARSVNTLSKSQAPRSSDRSPTEQGGSLGSENAEDALRVEDLGKP